MIYRAIIFIVLKPVTQGMGYTISYQVSPHYMVSLLHTTMSNSYSPSDIHPSPPLRIPVKSVTFKETRARPGENRYGGKQEALEILKELTSAQ
jgi:hypothetical protein